MKIKPFVGLENILFNVSRKDARARIAGTFRTFEQDVGGGDHIDYYNSLGMHLHYDDNDQLEAIETFEPCVAEYDDMKLIQMPANMIEQNFLEKGFTIKHNDEGFYILDIGVSIYAPFDNVEAVGVVRKEYLDELEFDD